jgi:hypothetical protein
MAPLTAATTSTAAPLARVPAVARVWRRAQRVAVKRWVEFGHDGASSNDEVALADLRHWGSSGYE